MKNNLSIILIGLFLLGNQVTKAQMAVSPHSGLAAICAKYTDQKLGENTFVFDPTMDMKGIQALIDSLYNQQHPRKSEFSINRYALLFKPGTYPIDLKLGYYMHVLGLGLSPDDVVIQGTIISKGLMKNGNVTLNFWRSVENLCVVSPSGGINVWGVSQAAPMRRLHIQGDLQLHDNGWASGGYIADSKIDGTVFAGPQQQWFSRNVELNQWKDGRWNIMFVGSQNPPADNWPENPYTVIKETPLIREKPYLAFDQTGYLVRIPKLKINTSGVSWMNRGQDEAELPLSGFYIVKPGVDQAESINAALARGKNLFFTPGIYPLNQPLKVTRPGTLIMGVGMPTLVSENGNAVIEISDVDGVTVCGFTVDAGKIQSEKLIVVGEPGSTKSHVKNPSFLYDIFIRIGGYGEGKASCCMEINSKNVCIDHAWLWRADHGKEVAWDKNTCKNGLVVNGDDVIVYGLFCEHFQEYQTLWNGNNGKVYFYQSEMPYDPPTAEAFNHGTTNGYASYKVSDGVTGHHAWGLGIYCVFFKAPVVVDQAIETPVALENDIHHKILYWLSGGNKASMIKSVINGKGGSVDVTNGKAMMD
jgi:hypothetical protein